MTFEGDYKAMNRTGMETNPSPFQQMSFESTVHYITDSALYGEYDKLKSPSARIVLGKPPRVGTGIFDCVQPIQLR